MDSNYLVKYSTGHSFSHIFGFGVTRKHFQRHPNKALFVNHVPYTGKD